jgi:hypothetical protein
MPTSECSEAVSGAAWSVLEKDCVLGLGAEVWHGGVESELARQRGSDAAAALAARKTVFDARFARTTQGYETHSNQHHGCGGGGTHTSPCEAQVMIALGCGEATRARSVLYFSRPL